MPFNVPTLPALIGRAQSDLAGDGGLRHSDAQVAARALAGAVYGLYGHQAWIADQQLPDRCEEEMLLRLAKLRPIRDRLLAVPATGSASFAGNAGAVLDADTLLQRDDGVQFKVAATVAGNAGSVTLEAVEAGVLGNTIAGAKLKLVSPVLGIVDGFTVTGDGLTGGTDQESIESLRVRVIRSYRQLPHGGNADDYVTWALEVPGVTRAWVRRRWVGPGTVGLFVLRDADPDPDPIPNAAALEEVAAYIEPLKPVDPELYVMAPIAKPVVYQIALSPDSSAIRAAVEANLRDLHYRESEPGVTLLRTHIAEAISSAEGERDHVLAFPADNVAAAGNEVLTFGGIVWQ